MTDKTDDEVLADALGLPHQVLLECAGYGWRELASDEVAVESELGEARWFIAGDPSLVMLGVTDAIAVVTAPRIEWRSVAYFVYRPSQTSTELTQPVDCGELSASIAQTARRKRATLRWCRYCHRLHDPGRMIDSSECHNCASTYHGVVI